MTWKEKRHNLPFVGNKPIYDSKLEFMKEGSKLAGYLIHVGQCAPSLSPNKVPAKLFILSE